MDIPLIEFILRRRSINLGHTIIRTKLFIPKLITRSLPYGHFITQTLNILRFLSLNHRVNLLRAWGMKLYMLKDLSREMELG